MDRCDKVSLLRSVGILVNQRNPFMFPQGGATTANHLVASYAYNTGGGAAANYVTGSSGIDPKINHESCVTVHWPNPVTSLRPIWRDNPPSRTWSAGAQIFWGGTSSNQNNNRQLFAPWAESDYFSGINTGNQSARIASAFPTGFVPYSVGTVGTSETPARAFVDLVLNYCGPTPAARLPVIQRAINFVKNRMAVNGQGYGTELPSLAAIDALIPTVAQNSISNPFATQTSWGNRTVPTLAASRDTPHASGAFSDGSSRVGYTRLEEFLYEVHLLRMPGP
jgi:hypothetical protein